jgi:hypothetical protein
MLEEATFELIEAEMADCIFKDWNWFTVVAVEVAEFTEATAFRCIPFEEKDTVFNVTAALPVLPSADCATAEKE